MNLTESLVSLRTVFLVLVFLGAVTVLFARRWRPAQLPNGAVDGCASCHISEGGAGPRTPFGEDVLAIVGGASRDEFWGASLAAMDSDDDGRTNGEELGDPSGTWAEGDPDPGDPGAVTNPGVPEGNGDVNYLRGDANADGNLDVSDAVFALLFLFDGRVTPTCLRTIDINNDGGTDLSDPLYLLNFLFAEGTPIAAPADACGTATGNSAALSCDAYAPCE